MFFEHIHLSLLKPIYPPQRHKYMLKIVITGASTGIGASTALELAAGNELFIHYNASQEAAQQVAAAVQERGGTAHLVQADVMTEQGCEALFNAVAEKTTVLDVLVNNAGGLIERHTVKEMNWSLMERIFALNTFSTMMLTRLFVPMLEKGKHPSIVNMTSVAMRFGAPTATLYAASKSAIDSYTRGAARELAPAIRVNAIAPGVILTPFHDRYTTPDRLEAMRSNTPLEHHGESKHIATAVRFLVENTFMTGETIDINGGLFMR